MSAPCRLPKAGWLALGRGRCEPVGQGFQRRAPGLEHLTGVIVAQLVEQEASASLELPLIPIRLNLDLLQVGVACEAL